MPEWYESITVKSRPLLQTQTRESGIENERAKKDERALLLDIAD